MEGRLHARIVALGDLALYPFHEDCQFLRFVVSLGLFAHSLEVLGSVSYTIRHLGDDPYIQMKEAIAYRIPLQLPIP
jgi:hypothetical protein